MDKEEQKRRINDCLRAIRRNEQNSVEDLFAISGKLLFSVAIKITHNIEDAEDVLSDIFADIDLIASRFVFGNGYNYLCVITRNRAINFTNKNNRHRSDSIVDLEDYLQNCDYGNVNDFSDIADALKSLKGREYACVYRKYWLGMTYREIAEVEGISAATVMRTLKSAEKKLSELIER